MNTGNLCPCKDLCHIRSVDEEDIDFVAAVVKKRGPTEASLSVHSVSNSSLERDRPIHILC